MKHQFLKFNFITFMLMSMVITSCGNQVEIDFQDYKIRAKDGVLLAATLAKPKDISRTPLIILVHGSGDDTRQNEYYKMLRKEFCNIGFSVICYDKRGCDSSAGNWLTVPFSYLKDDVLSIAERFSTDTTFSKIGLWGGSEGSNLAVWAASENEDIDFVIAQSFTAMTFAEQNKFAKIQSLKRFPNVDKHEFQSALKLQDLLNDFIRTGKNYDKYIHAFSELENEEWFSEIFGSAVSENGSWKTWYATKIDLNSTVFVSKLKVPALFIWGQADQLIDVNRSVDLVKSSCQNNSMQFKVFDKANHGIYSGGSKPDHLSFMKIWLKNVSRYE